MKSFLGASLSVTSDAVTLSRVFLWYGADFVYPRWMPTFLPATKTQVARALDPWLPPEVQAALLAGTGVTFGSYDWGLRCSVG